MTPHDAVAALVGAVVHHQQLSEIRSEVAVCAALADLGVAALTAADAATFGAHNEFVAAVGRLREELARG